MVKRIGSSRRKTRSKLSKHFRTRGKISISRYLPDLKIGDRVYLGAEPAVQKGFYFHRFYGKCGVVKGKKGRCYEISIKDINKEKLLIIHPVHLKKV